MYGKIFDSMYEGTLYGHWEAIVTLQQMIVLCTPDGVVDMTPQAIAARTSIPIEIITKGLKVLSEPDPFTRTPGEEGRRLTLIDGHRPWGWQIVNHEKYKNMRDVETVRAQTRERVRKHRRLNAGLPAEGELFCAYCGWPAVGLDHIIPKSEGGTEEAENIVPCCFRCNQHKGQQAVSKFLSNPQYSFINIDLILSNPKLERFVTARNDRKRYSDSDSDASTDANSNADAKKRKGQRPADAAAPAAENGVETWEAYRAAFRARYSVDPVRNAKVNGQVTALVKRLGSEEAPRVAEFYVTHNGQAYVARGHSLGMLLIDAEKLRTEWATGRRITMREARSAEVGDAVREQVARVSEKMEGKDGKKT